MKLEDNKTMEKPTKKTKKIIIPNKPKIEIILYKPDWYIGEDGSVNLDYYGDTVMFKARCHLFPVNKVPQWCHFESERFLIKQITPELWGMFQGAVEARAMTVTYTEVSNIPPVYKIKLLEQPKP